MCFTRNSGSEGCFCTVSPDFRKRIWVTCCSTEMSFQSVCLCGIKNLIPYMKVKHSAISYAFKLMIEEIKFFFFFNKA